MARPCRAALADVHAQRLERPASRGRRPLRLRSALAIGGLLLWTGLAFAGAPAQATSPGLNGRLACEGTRPVGGTLPMPAPAGASLTEVFTVNPDGTGETVLTNNMVRDGDPSFSPDGKLMAFESFRELAVNPTNMMTVPASEVFRMNAADGSNAMRLTTNGTPEDRSTSWSPDGSRIVFHSTRDPVPPGSPAGSSTFEIYSMNADGSDQRRLTNNIFQDTFPAWSPDGKRIAFLSTREGDIEIYTMDPDGGNVVRVTDSIGEDAHASWSPDGKQLTFHSRRTGTIDIYRQNADGTGQATRLTTSETDSEFFPIWSPDGKRIAFNGTVPGSEPANTDVYTISALNGSDLTRVTTAPGFDGRCDWQTLPLPPPVVTPPPAPAPAPTPVPSLVVPPDRTAPTVTLAGVPATMSRAAFLRGVKVRVTRNEPSSIEATLEAVARRASLAATFNVSLASRSTPRASGTTVITLKPSRALVGRARTLGARVRVVVIDAFGNRRIVTKLIRVKR